ncbi:MAG: hypothetical protein ACOYVF_03335 [Candidatus Zixiibacteriota bacterium]
MRPVISVIVLVFIGCLTAAAQNCCAPSVPQQGVLGETVALPHTLEVGLHYEYLRSKNMYLGSVRVEDPANTRSVWCRTTLALSYGIIPRLSVSAVLPYLSKRKNLTVSDYDVEYATDGIGDMTFIVRYSLIARDFVNFRELSLGLGVKAPAGATDKRNLGFTLPEELQPGTGSWDYHVSLSFYQGFEPVDFVLSGTYLMTGTYEGFKFGNQFSYLLAANYHLFFRIDITAAFSGTVKGKDIRENETVCTTGRHQLWFTPGVQVQVIRKWVRLQVFFETPLYQHFDGIQLGSDYNIRLSLAGLIPFGKSGDEE